ncbi:MAG: hypothetical protein CW716_10740 [Candidatus Bathyarchaeum sp.]|nr:MAG: hypothetical protein CW716_10740 [Candidatus Bathyarchaeum sp.]
MEKSDSGIRVLAAGLLIVLTVGFLFLLSQYEDSRFEPRWEEIRITNVEFEGTSGLENNSIVLYLENTNKVTDAVLKQVQVLGDGFNRTFSIKPEDSNYPTGSQGQITITNVGWTKNADYQFRIISSNECVCGAITKTA